MRGRTDTKKGGATCRPTTFSVIGYDSHSPYFRVTALMAS